MFLRLPTIWENLKIGFVKYLFQQRGNFFTAVPPFVFNVFNFS